LKLIKLSPDELSRIQRNIGRLLTEDELKQLPYSYDSFAHFTYTIYKWAVEKHFGKFIGGQFIIGNHQGDPLPLGGGRNWVRIPT